MTKNWITLFFATALTIVVLLLWDNHPKNLLNLDNKTQDSPFYDFPYATLKNAASKHYDNIGNLSYTFEAQKLEHYRGDFAHSAPDDYMLLHEPVFTLSTDNKPWYVAARKGKLENNGETLTLWDNVLIRRGANATPGKRLRTSKLTVILTSKHIWTDQQVIISSPQGSIKATGMEVDVKSQKIKLLSNVRGLYETI